jgi:2-amino-4-hydroxy-6-hydroxymethyldihydropteridine diphosphokinase
MVQLNASAAFIGLGSNVGHRQENLKEALERIKSSGFDVLRASSVYETEPVGDIVQPWFLNQVVEAGALVSQPGSNRPEQAVGRSGESRLRPPTELLACLLAIERDMGRERTIKDGPRIIDLDLLFYGDLMITEADGSLVIPHPRLHLRRVVLVPMCEIAPELVHPRLRKTCCQLLADLTDGQAVRAL